MGSEHKVVQTPSTMTALADLLKGGSGLLKSLVTAINMGKTLMMTDDLVGCKALVEAQKKRFTDGWAPKVDKNLCKLTDAPTDAPTEAPTEAPTSSPTQSPVIPTKCASAQDICANKATCASGCPCPRCPTPTKKPCPSVQAICTGRAECSKGCACPKCLPPATKVPSSKARNSNFGKAAAVQSAAARAAAAVAQAAADRAKIAAMAAAKIASQLSKLGVQ